MRKASRMIRDDFCPLRGVNEFGRCGGPAKAKTKQGERKREDTDHEALSNAGRGQGGCPSAEGRYGTGPPRHKINSPRRLETASIGTGALGSSFSDLAATPRRHTGRSAVQRIGQGSWPCCLQGAARFRRSEATSWAAGPPRERPDMLLAFWAAWSRTSRVRRLSRAKFSRLEVTPRMRRWRSASRSRSRCRPGPALAAGAPASLSRPPRTPSTAASRRPFCSPASPAHLEGGIGPSGLRADAGERPVRPACTLWPPPVRDA